MAVVSELRLWIGFADEGVDDELDHWNFGREDG
jgi:hypothetical protein